MTTVDALMTHEALGILRAPVHELVHVSRLRNTSADGQMTALWRTAELPGGGLGPTRHELIAWRFQSVIAPRAASSISL